MATLKLYNPILSEATKECYWFCDEAGTSFKDVDEFINGIPAGDDNIELLLHCDGGEVSEGWAIVDKLRSTGKKITATIEGNCASMATVVCWPLPNAEHTRTPRCSFTSPTIPNTRWPTRTVPMISNRWPPRYGTTNRKCSISTSSEPEQIARNSKRL